MHFSNCAWPAMMIPTITPKSPRAVAKISITRIFTKSLLFWASASAHPLPQMPTQTPHTRFVKPVAIPEPITAKPADLSRLRR